MHIKGQRGVALLAVIFFLVVMAFVGVIFISLSSTNTTQSVNELNSSRALYVAEGGMESARTYLLTPSCPTCTCISINGNALFTNVPIGQGQFTVTSTLLGGQCTLTSTGGVPTIASGTAQRVVTYIATSLIQDAWAVGYNVNLGGSNNRPFMAHWDGTAWSNTTATSPTISSANLMEVSMVNSTDGWAVSNLGDFIHYNGSNWSLSAGFNSTGTLYSIYMNSASDGWAVGQTTVSGSNRGEIDRWNGTSWSRYTAYYAPNTLQGVYCLNSTFCWAVGNRTGSGNNQSNINFWDGTNWSFVNTSFAGASFRYVSCVDTMHCWAVGTSGGEIIFWNGTSWAFQDNGNPTLLGVDCVDISNCWAVGNSGANNLWNGSIWTLKTPPTTRNLTFVSCVIASDCWATGTNGTLIHWNGSNWANGAPGGSWPTSQLNSLSQFRSSNTATSWKEVFQ
jgi:Tfp pilus assembly protein PilX